MEQMMDLELADEKHWAFKKMHETSRNMLLQSLSQHSTIHWGGGREEYVMNSKT